MVSFFLTRSYSFYRRGVLEIKNFRQGVWSQRYMCVIIILFLPKMKTI